MKICVKNTKANARGGRFSATRRWINELGGIKAVSKTLRVKQALVNEWLAGTQEPGVMHRIKLQVKAAEARKQKGLVPPNVEGRRMSRFLANSKKPLKDKTLEERISDLEDRLRKIDFKMQNLVQRIDSRTQQLAKQIGSRTKFKSFA